MAFTTSLNTPKCARLKSSMQRATDDYDKKVLRRLHSNLKGPVSEREKHVRAVPLPPPIGKSEQDMCDKQWAAKRVKLPSNFPEKVQTVDRRGAYSDQDAFIPPKSYSNPELFGGEAGSSAAGSSKHVVEYRHERDWLQESLQVAKQAEGHATYTHDLRKRSDGLNKRTDVKAKETRLDTNHQLRSKVRDVQKVKAKVEEAVNEAETEFKALGQVKQFIIEIKALHESGAVAGSEMRMGLRESRPAAELTHDNVDTALEKEYTHHRQSIDIVTRIIKRATSHMEHVRQCVDTLYDNLEDKVEGLRIDEQCLVLDGSSSVNVHMGGSSNEQPPLEIMLDAKAREVIQGTGATVIQTPKVTKEDTNRAVRESRSAVTASLNLRKEFKKQLMNMDMEGRKLNKKVEATLLNKVKLQEKLLRTLERRISCLVEERTHLEAQMDTVRQGLTVKNREKDIVCKRLRLRSQIPNKDLVDKVHDALEVEYDVLSEAVQQYTGKLSHITLEISRMHDTLKTLEASYSTKRTALSLDQKCLDLVFICNQPWPQQLYNGICSGLTAVYGCS